MKNNADYEKIRRTKNKRRRTQGRRNKKLMQRRKTRIWRTEKTMKNEEEETIRDVDCKQVGTRKKKPETRRETKGECIENNRL